MIAALTILLALSGFLLALSGLAAFLLHLDDELFSLDTFGLNEDDDEWQFVQWEREWSQ